MLLIFDHVGNFRGLVRKRFEEFFVKLVQIFAGVRLFPHNLLSDLVLVLLAFLCHFSGDGPCILANGVWQTAFVGLAEVFKAERLVIVQGEHGCVRRRSV